MIHELKTWPQYFEKVLDGTKTFEVRKHDREFKVGDALCLREFDLDGGIGSGCYTGRAIYRNISYIIAGAPEFGLDREFCIMGLAVQDEKAKPANSITIILPEHIRTKHSFLLIDIKQAIRSFFDRTAYAHGAVEVIADDHGQAYQTTMIKGQE